MESEDIKMIAYDWYDWQGNSVTDVMIVAKSRKEALTKSHRMSSEISNFLVDNSKTSFKYFLLILD